MSMTTIEFTKESERALARLSDQLRVRKTDVVRNALSLYAFVVERMTSEPLTQLAFTRGAHGEVINMISVPGIDPICRPPETDTIQ